jgi:hypothetical protein
VQLKRCAEERAAADKQQCEATRDIELLEGKSMRENMKKELFVALYVDE